MEDNSAASSDIPASHDLKETPQDQNISEEEDLEISFKQIPEMAGSETKKNGGMGLFKN